MKEFIIKEIEGQKMLFTGFYDKGGQRIFEGDVLDFGHYKAVVEWGMDSEEHELHKVCGFVLRILKNDNFIIGLAAPQITPFGKWSGAQQAKVVGNIYE